MTRQNLFVMAAVAGAMAACAAPVTSVARAGDYTVSAETITEMKAVFGQVESRIVVPARARIGGSVRDISVHEGDEAKEGESLAVVVDDKIALQLDAADANIDALNSQLRNAKIEYDRAKQLRATGTGTQSRLDQARTAYNVATNQLAAARAQKAVIEQSAREGSVLAPASGRVLTVPVTLGSVVLPGEVIARIAPGPYYLRLSLPERHASQIVQGTTVMVGERGLTQTNGHPVTAHTGKIVKVYPEIQDGRVIADVEVPNIGDYFVKERMLVTVPVAKQTVLGIPPEAVRTVHGVDYVRLVSSHGEMDVAVILGEHYEDQGAERIEVLSGLHDGDRIILP